MTSFVPTQYYGHSYYTNHSHTPLTPLTPVTQTLSHVRCDSTLEPEMAALKSMLSNHRSLPYAGRRSSHSKGNSLNNRLAYVEALVDTNALVIETMWYGGQSTSTNASTTPAVVPLRTFIQEVLKRSRTTYSTLQTALFYLFRSQPAIMAHLGHHQPSWHDNTRKRQPIGQDQWEYAYISCGRRMFLASLVIASKFVQDKTYRNSAWAKIAGLPIAEINAAERIFLELIDYRLFISQSTFEQWHQLLHLHVEAKTQQTPPLYMAYDLPSPLSSPPMLLPSTPPPCSSSSSTSSIVSPPLTSHYHHPPPSLPPPLPMPPSLLSYSQPNVAAAVAAAGHRKRKYSLVDSPASPLSTPLPVLTLSLPSSSHSSPLQTPTQISPIRSQLGKPHSPKKRKFEGYCFVNQPARSWKQRHPH
ncbi:hypothetical protein DM01DRAFT_1332181 [Hesseltinella vesiculosa]|uniref:Cyclin-domain-containing protein n=1 Tax=Hesseltinella vesiculosa TaxID=101127 RepID=A0A1X2GUA6_9FUNG|nr:hypothetical protein DM01DRAFT_1332181 [Hesseltinella vesiculosa]